MCVGHHSQMLQRDSASLAQYRRKRVKHGWTAWHANTTTCIIAARLSTSQHSVFGGNIIAYYADAVPLYRDLPASTRDRILSFTEESTTPAANIFLAVTRMSIRSGEVGHIKPIYTGVFRCLLFCKTRRGTVSKCLVLSPESAPASVPIAFAEFLKTMYTVNAPALLTMSILK